MGAVLARTSLLMKDWGTDPDEKPDRRVWTEAVALGIAVVAAYLAVAYLLAMSLLE